MRFETRLRPIAIVVSVLALCSTSACIDIPDRVDASAGKYLEMRDGPPRMVDGNGNYVPGWWSKFDGKFNAGDATGEAYTFKTWLHFNIDDPKYYVVAQLVVTDIAGNLAIAVSDKTTGEFYEEDIVYTFGDQISGDDAATSFTDSDTGSSIALKDGVLTFELKTDGIDIVGRATEIFDRPLIQTTAYQAGYGDLIFWGNIRLDEGALTLDGTKHTLAPGSLGLYDRTIGHKRTTMNWNYVAMAGVATDLANGATATIALQGSVDKERTKPFVDAKAFALWVDGQIFKVPQLHFDYRLNDASTRTTSPWRVHTGSKPGDDGLDMTVKPPKGRDRMFHRRNKSAELWLFERDFNQYYGEASGTITRGGRTWSFERLYVLLEDAYVVL